MGRIDGARPGRPRPGPGQGSAAAGVILASTDGGTTWTSQPVPSGVVGVDGVNCSSTDTCYAVATTADTQGQTELRTDAVSSSPR